ncbi:MAG: outer membrane beta-barrel protein [Candidatus Zixiibacteriota bacterium]
MRTTKIIVTIVLASFILATSTGAGPLENRHQLELRMGMFNQSNSDLTLTTTSIAASGVSSNVTSTVNANGFMGQLTYGYWFTEGLALNASVGGMLASVETQIEDIGITTESAYIGRVLVGLKKYLPGSTFNSSLRPYVKAMVGPCIGSQTSTQVSSLVTSESRSEVVVGGQAAAGVDLLVGPHVLMGLNLGYNLMPDFSEPIGASKNYSGPEISFGVSYLIGKIKQ